MVYLEFADEYSINVIQEQQKYVFIWATRRYEKKIWSFVCDASSSTPEPVFKIVSLTHSNTNFVWLELLYPARVKSSHGIGTVEVASSSHFFIYFVL